MTLLRLYDVVHAPRRRRLGEQLIERRPHALPRRALEPRVVRGGVLPRRRHEQLIGIVGCDLELGRNEAGDTACFAQDPEPGEQLHDLVAAAGLRPQSKDASDHGGGL